MKNIVAIALALVLFSCENEPVVKNAYRATDSLPGHRNGICTKYSGPIGEPKAEKVFCGDVLKVSFAQLESMTPSQFEAICPKLGIGMIISAETCRRVFDAIRVESDGICTPNKDISSDAIVFLDRVARFCDYKLKREAKHTDGCCVDMRWP